MNYSVPDYLLQEIINHLGAAPAVQTRNVLNQIERLCTEQDQAAAEEQRKSAVNAALEELKKTQPEQGAS